MPTLTYTIVPRYAAYLERLGFTLPPDARTHDLPVHPLTFTISAPFEPIVAVWNSQTLTPPNGIEVCSLCGGLMADGGTAVASRSLQPQNLSKWCLDCLETDAFYCMASEHHWSNSNDRARWYDGGFVSLPYVSDNPSAYTFNGTTWGWIDEHEGEEYEYDERDDDDRVPEYHSVQRPWERYSYDLPTSDTFGVELETYAAPSRLEAFRLRPSGWIGETDGSLDRYHGIEFVAPPLPWSAYGDGCEWEQFLSRLRALKVKGWNAGTGYGMHVNLGRQSIEDGDAARFSVLVNNLPTLASDVAGRESVQWAQFIPKRLHSWQSRSKYEAVHVKDRVLEVRIFRSTLSWRGFRRNLEFCKAALDYSRLNPSEAALVESEFGKFLSTRGSEYPNLYAHLSRNWFTLQRPKRKRGVVATDEAALVEIIRSPIAPRAEGFEPTGSSI